MVGARNLLNKLDLVKLTVTGGCPRIYELWRSSPFSTTLSPYLQALPLNLVSLVLYDSSYALRMLISKESAHLFAALRRLRFLRSLTMPGLKEMAQMAELAFILRSKIGSDGGLKKLKVS